MVRTGRRDATGSIVGLAVFLAGVGLLGLTFKLAHELLSIQPERALSLVPGKAIDPAATGGGLLGVILRLGTLLVMAIMGSLVANKGIGLYCGSLHPLQPQDPTPKPREELV